jgi:dihydroflavonol-4-reductase
MKKVGIIGGAGFIGSHITRIFLEEGFKVRVSTTDISKESKYQHLKKLPNSENLEIVQLDVRNESELQHFLEGCKIVIHGGTPFQLAVTDPQSELFDPTVRGTETFLKAIENTQGIEKVIFIASVAAWNTNFPLPAGSKAPGEPFSERDTPFYGAESHPYAQAKFLAQRAVEKFIESHPHLKFEITTFSPVMVVGKSLSTREDSTSTGIQFLFKNKIAPDPFFQMFYNQDIEFALVDVEDVAESVFQAAITGRIHGKNNLLSSESFPVSAIHNMLNGLDPNAPGKIIYSNSLVKKELGVSFKHPKVSFKEYSELNPMSLTT